jgi:hypothetical protein
MSVSSIVSGGVASASSAISGAAKSSSNAFADLFARARAATSNDVSTATTGSTVGELTHEAETKLSEFKRAVQQILSTAGIDNSWEVRLQSDGNGGVQVSPGHPECDKIEQLLQQNPDLIEKFKELQAAFGRLRSGSGEGTAKDAAAMAGFNVVFAEETARVEFQ